MAGRLAHEATLPRAQPAYKLHELAAAPNGDVRALARVPNSSARLLVARCVLIGAQLFGN